MTDTKTYEHATSPQGIARVLREMAQGEIVSKRCGDFWLSVEGMSPAAMNRIADLLDPLPVKCEACGETSVGINADGKWLCPECMADELIAAKFGPNTTRG